MRERLPASPGSIRWIPPLTLPGTWQMAIDEWLLERCGPDGGGAALRFYRWRRPTLSLGFHQRRLEPRWHRLAATGVIDLVRRPSGGRAVLHAGDLTYALAWPRPPLRREEAYRQACGWLQEAFQDLGLPLTFGDQAAGAGTASCFASRTAADLRHPCGAKRIGSAQLWRGGRLLQHGTILLTPPPRLWWEVFGEEPPRLPRLPVDRRELVVRLRQAAALHLPLLKDCPGPLRPGPLGRRERTAIAGRRGRYRVEPGTGGETSPEATIARATWPRAMP